MAASPPLFRLLVAVFICTGQSGYHGSMDRYAHAPLPARAYLAPSPHNPLRCRAHRLMLSFMVTAISSAPPLTGNECLAGITSSEFNLRKLDQYERWFDDKSSMTLAQTGVYKGLDAVLEYSKFIFPGSPYISTNGNLGSEFTFVSVDAEKRSCVFIVVEQQRYQMSEMASNELFESPVMFKAEWRRRPENWIHSHLLCASCNQAPPRATVCVLQ